VSEAFLGEIRLFPFTFAPMQWMPCAGQTLQISQSSALFSILGTSYGGDGRTTFCLPNLQGRVIVGVGQGVGLSSYSVGEMMGESSVLLSQTQMPGHNHSFAANTIVGAGVASAGNQLSQTKGGGREGGGVTADLYNPAAPNVAMSPTALTAVGGGQAHNNMQPYLAMLYCICVAGAFPMRP